MGDVAGELKTSTNPRLTFEIALTRMVRPRRRCDAGSSGRARGNPERQLAGASVVAAVAPASAGVPVAAPAPVSAAAPAAVVSAAVASASAATAPAAVAPAGANPAAVAPAGASPVGGDLGRPSAPAGSAPCDSPSASLAEGRPRSAPTEEVVPAAAPAAATSAAVAPAPSTASAPVSAPSASAAAGALSPEITAALSNMASLQRLWAGVLASLKKSKAAYGVLFMNTKAVFDAAAGALLIEFPAENDFAFRAVQKPDVQAELAQALRREAHGDIPFELRKGGASAPMASAPAAASAFNVPAPASQSVPAPSAASSAASASPMSGAPSSVSAPAVPASAAVPALSPAPAPDDDRPPYDDYVPYDDADIPFEDPFASRGASPQGAATSRRRASPQMPLPQPLPKWPPWEEAPQVPALSGATPSACVRSCPSPAPSMAAPSASALPPEPDAVSGPSPNPVEEPDLAASLAFGFGDGVNFEEVV
ncbi:MAG: hypothetical protein ACLTDR_09265 [Adlercreutzia equolifaciens]